MVQTKKASSVAKHYWAKQLRKILTRNHLDLAEVEGNLIAATKGRPIRKILVTSPLPREGKSTVSVALSNSLSEFHQLSVLLVEGNPRSPQLSSMLADEGSLGITNFTDGGGKKGNRTPASLCHSTEFDGVKFTPLGTAANEVYRTEAFHKPLDHFSSEFDYVVVDGDCIIGSPTTPLISSYFDAILMVVESEKSRWDTVQRAQKIIEDVDGKLIGLILNKKN